MIRSLAMIVIGLLLLIQPAQAGSDTYCVGGFEFVGGYASRQACATYRNIHRRWHFHVYVPRVLGRRRHHLRDDVSAPPSRLSHHFPL
jgi:hypothetical protein